MLAVVHGYGEHGGRYRWLGEDMAARGYAVHVYDLRGHGRSAGRRGQIRRFDDYLDDTAVFLDEVRREQPGKPLVLLGHSLGGLICRRFAEERRPRPAGLILSSPFSAPGRASPDRQARSRRRLLSVVAPGRERRQHDRSGRALARPGGREGLRHRPAEPPRGHGEVGRRGGGRAGRGSARRAGASACRCCCCTATPTRSPTRQAARELVRRSRLDRQDRALLRGPTTTRSSTRRAARGIRRSRGLARRAARRPEGRASRSPAGPPAVM